MSDRYGPDVLSGDWRSRGRTQTRTVDAAPGVVVELADGGFVVIWCARHRWRGREERADGSELRAAMTVREKAHVADALEAIGQDVEQKAAKELACI